MTIESRLLKLSVSFLFTPLLFSTASASESNYHPPSRVECIAPANPGGGWDFTCRTVGRLLQQHGIISGGVQTTNMPGASGGVAFAHVATKRKDDDGVIVAASTATTTRLAQNQFPGLNADTVRWVGALGADYGVLAVRKASPYQDLSDLIEAMREKSGQVSFAGGSARGGKDHLQVLLTARTAGIDKLRQIKYLPFDGGGEALTQVMGGHIDVFTGDVSEVLGFRESGDLRVLAVLSDERLPGKLDSMPTAKEQGVDATMANWRGFYLPAGVTDDEYQWWTATLDRLYTSPDWEKVMKQNGIMPFHKTGQEFKQYVQQQIKNLRELSGEIGLVRQG